MPCYKQIEWEGKFFRLGRCCYYCGTPLTLRGATKDHVVPIERGGLDDLFNTVPACWPCNHLKGTMTESEFRRARPERCTASTANTTVSSKAVLISYEEKNEPGLLKRVASERDSMRASWFWRNPAA